MTKEEGFVEGRAVAGTVHTEFNTNPGDFVGGLTGVTAAREYKDRIFRMVFKEKREFLELYNALNGTAYTNPDDLVATTLQNAIYMAMKNDVSFMVYDELVLYEHQSTRNPNMPLRDLFYVADMYSALLKENRLLASTLVRIPAPRFVVFYSGADEAPESEELRLSDAFFTAEDDPQLELKVKVLNINVGNNETLMERCTTLKDYMAFVTKVRKYAKTMSLTEAVNKAVDECIREGILVEFLKRNRNEVVKMSIYEYDEEADRRCIREDGIAEGWKKGEASGKAKGKANVNSLNIKLGEAGRWDDILRAAKDQNYQMELFKEFHLA